MVSSRVAHLFVLLELEEAAPDLVRQPARLGRRLGQLQLLLPTAPHPHRHRSTTVLVYFTITITTVVCCIPKLIQPIIVLRSLTRNFIRGRGGG